MKSSRGDLLLNGVRSEADPFLPYAGFPPVRNGRGSDLPGINARSVSWGPKDEYRHPDKRQREKESDHRKNAETEQKKGKPHRQQKHSDDHFQDLSESTLSVVHDFTPFSHSKILAFQLSLRN
jgi:hypothetical protein